MPSQTNDDEEDVLEIKPDGFPKLRAVLEMFLIDFLGGLVPGLLFLLACSCIVVSSLHTVFLAIHPGSKISLFQIITTQLPTLNGTPSAFWFCTFLILVILAFVIGHLFYRSDPKLPDTKAFNRLKKCFENEYRSGKIDDLSKKAGYTSDQVCEINLGAAKVQDCQFPYRHYEKYLKHRGHDHLIPLAVWCEQDKFERSKTYVNLLKIRLRFFFPEKCSMIVWNEAHVRLASSTWYVGRVLMYFSAVALAASVLVFLLILAY